MAPSKLEILTQGVTLAMVAALRQFAQEAQAGTFTDHEMHDLLARFGGSMVKTLAHLQALGDHRRARLEKVLPMLLQ